MADRECAIVHPPGERLAAERLEEAWREQGRAVKIASAVGDAADAAQTTIRYRLVAPAEGSDIEGDGFAILPAGNGHGLTVTARTRFGLLQAVRRMIEHMTRSAKDSTRVPLMAGNPAVRCGRRIRRRRLRGRFPPRPRRRMGGDAGGSDGAG